jgi:hypothetical protein
MFNAVNGKPKKKQAHNGHITVGVMLASCVQLVNEI